MAAPAPAPALALPSAMLAGLHSAPAAAPAPAMGMSGFPAGPSSSPASASAVPLIQQQLMMVQQQIQAITMHLASNPHMQGQLMPQVMVLQQQQQGLLNALTQAMAAPVAPAPFSPTASFPPAAPGGLLGLGVGAIPAGGAINGGSVVRGGLLAAPAPAPAPAPKQPDAFDFIGGEFGR
jgi:hypothetical protein